MIQYNTNKMSKYQKSIIYKIYDNTNGNVYYGSTYNLLRVRIQGHRDDAKIDTKNCASKQIILNGNYSYSMVEPYPCNSKQELHTRERYWIENFDCVNKVVPGRTRKEYYQDNKEQILEYSGEHYTKNKEEICRKSTEYNAKNKEEISKKRSSKIVCECGTEISKRNIAAHRKSAKHIKLMTLICPPCPP